MSLKSLLSPLPRGFVRDSVHQYGLTGGLVLSEFAYTALLARGLGRRDFGILVLLLSAARICQGITDVRVHEFVMRYAERARGLGSASALQQTLSRALRIDLMATAAGVALAVAIGAIAPGVFPGVVHHRDLLMLAILATAAMWSGRYWSIGVLRLFHRVDRQAAVQLCGAFSRLAVTAIWFVCFKATIEAVLVISTVCIGAAAVALVVVARRVGREETQALSEDVQLNVDVWHEWRAYVASNYAIGLLETAYRELDVQLLGWIRGAEEVSIYKVAKTFASAIMQVVDPVATLLFPQFARDVTAGRMTELRRFIVQVSAAFLAGGLILGIGAHVLAPIVFPRIAGVAYASSVTPFRIIVWCIVITMPLLFTHPLSMAFGRPQLYLAASAVGLCVLVFMAAIAVPSLGSSGAAYAYGGSQLTIAILSFCLLLRRLRGLSR